ncbi:unnamed protein product, partial [marine sediment metagenome]
DGGSATPTTSDGGGAVPTTSSKGAASGGGHSSSGTGLQDAHFFQIASVDFDGQTNVLRAATGPYRGIANADAVTVIKGHVHTVYNHTHPGHTHTVTIANHNHTVTIANHNHTVTIAAHTHNIPHTHNIEHTHTVPAHSHNITYGIFEEETSPTIVPSISRDNGLTYSLPMGSYQKDQELDITRFIETSGNKIIKFESNKRARLSVQVTIRLDVKAR